MSSGIPSKRAISPYANDRANRIGFPTPLRPENRLQLLAGILQNNRASLSGDLLLSQKHKGDRKNREGSAAAAGREPEVAPWSWQKCRR